MMRDHASNRSGASGVTRRAVKPEGDVRLDADVLDAEKHRAARQADPPPDLDARILRPQARDLPHAFGEQAAAVVADDDDGALRVAVDRDEPQGARERAGRGARGQ
jgi:hypothetical protein